MKSAVYNFNLYINYKIYSDPRKTTILNDNHEVDNHFIDIINTNFTGLVHVTRHAYLLMKKSDDFCKIINICSITGHNVMSFMNNFEGQEANVYHGTKHAVKATTEILRQELIALKNDKIRVSVRLNFCFIKY